MDLEDLTYELEVSVKATSYQKYFADSSIMTFYE